MRKFFLYIIISNFISINAIATNIKIDHEINTSFQCKFEKIIIKNAEYNYKVFTSDEIDNENLDNFEIISKIPKDLAINELSSFLSNSENLEVKIVNTEVVLFKGFDKTKNYSESGIINRKSGELVHEITRDINSETSEKDITFIIVKKLIKTSEEFSGAPARIRTADLLITNQLLYQLSYKGILSFVISFFLLSRYFFMLIYMMKNYGCTVRNI